MAVDADAVVPAEPAHESFKPISGRSAKIIQRGGRVQHIELPMGCLENLRRELPRACIAGSVPDVFGSSLARVCPSVLDAQLYATGLAAATAVWAIIRLVRLPKLLVRDEPHPMGFSRRGQLLDTLQTAIDAASEARILSTLRTWFERSSAALRRRWRGLPPSQPLYPAFR